MIAWEKYALPAAKEFWGLPNKHPPGAADVFWGTHNARKVTPATGIWYDFETEQGGGTKDLIERYAPGARCKGGAAAWLRDNLGVEIDDDYDGGDLSALQKPARITDKYVYVTAAGEPHLIVYRWGPGWNKKKGRWLEKDFSQAAPDGRRPTDVPGFKPVPYRLDKITQAGRRTPIFICEGEKDVHSLEALGLIATCNPAGAGSWKPEYAQHLEGRRLVLLPDNDEPGQRHMQTVAASMLLCAAEIRIVELPGLPDRGDPTDWIEAGGTRQQLIDLCAGTDALSPDEHIEIVTPLRALSLGALLSRRPSGWLIDGMVPANSLTAIWGEPGAYKTFLVLDMMLSLAHGADWHGAELNKELVVYVAGEGVGGLRKRVGAWHHERRLEATDADFILVEEPAPLDADGAKALIDTIDALRDDRQVAAIVYDTLARCMVGDENSAADMSAAIGAVDDVRSHYAGSTAILVHHQGKDATRALRGSTALLGALDASLQARKAESYLEVVQHKQKDSEQGPARWFEAKVVEFQIGALDDEETSLVLSSMDAAPKVKVQDRLTEPMETALRALREAVEVYGKEYAQTDIPWPTVEEEQWRSVAAGMTLSSGGSEAQSKAFRRAAGKLMEKGLVVAQSGRYWVVEDAKKRNWSSFDE
jgi:hypothetical protein